MNHLSILLGKEVLNNVYTVFQSHHPHAISEQLLSRNTSIIIFPRAELNRRHFYYLLLCVAAIIFAQHGSLTCVHVIDVSLYCVYFPIVC